MSDPSKCPDCGHTHAGPELGGICVGCACERKPEPGEPVTRPHLRLAPADAAFIRAVALADVERPARSANVVAVGRSIPSTVKAGAAKPSDWVPVDVEVLDTGTTRELALSLVDCTGTVIRGQEDTTIVLDRANVEAVRDRFTAWLEGRTL